jgi:predicted GNAT family acetyltransferase
MLQHMSEAMTDDSDLDVTVTNNEAASQYEIHISGDLAGLTTYRRDDDRVVFRHAEVYPKWEGRGVGSELARAALDDVVSEGLTIVPHCPFIANYIARNPSYLAHVEETERQEIEATIAVERTEDEGSGGSAAV